MAEPAQPLLSGTAISRLADWMRNALDARAVSVITAEKLSGGAVQENWRVDVEVDGGKRSGRQHWVLRTDSPARLSISLDRLQEYACLQVAHDAGVQVAEPIASCADTTVIGRPFLLQARVKGVAQGRRIVRDPQLDDYASQLVREIGRQMALLHRIKPPRSELKFLATPGGVPASDVVQQLRLVLDECSQPRPALEHILVWLHANAPKAHTTSLVHGDLRTGNIMVDKGKLTAILDWEFCHWGDPREDIGWLCARCWRFGNDEREAGGIASKTDLLDGYNTHAEHPVAIEEIPFWEVLASARWAAIAALQGDRFLRRGEPSLELALTGLMPAEMELDALLLIAAMPRKP
jgi:aminoglycoside phosphotransferase (APT) family kinase protein